MSVVAGTGSSAAQELRHTERARISHALAVRMQAVQDLWELLGERGPTGGVTPDADRAQVHERFLRPLGLLLCAALDGADEERAIYLDERLRCLPRNLSGTDQAALLEDHLEAEAALLADLVAGDVPPDAVTGTLRELHRPLTTPPTADSARVLFVGDCLFNDVRVFLGERLWREEGRRLDADHLYFSAGNIPLAPEDIGRSVAAVPPSLIGLSLFTYSGVPPYSALLQDARRLRGAALEPRIDLLIDMLRSCIAAVREVSDAPIVVHGACGLPIGARRLRMRFVPAEWPSRRRLVRRLTERVRELVDATENTLLLDEDAVIRAAGGLRRVGGPILDERFAGAYTHPSHFGPVLAREYADVVASVQAVGRAKALFVDFDNTLWSGVMGDGDVVHDHAGQRLLRQLREAGVLLIALSKNDPGNIRWSEMELEPEDFVLQKIDWRPKPEGVREAIDQLDLAPEAFVLLDDNPVERALVQENVPGVGALDPTDPFTWRTLRRWLEFPSTQRTAEAQRRTEMYRQATERRQALGGRELDYDAMMRSLQLRAEVMPAGPKHVHRIVELVARTNQFNTTARRRSVGEIRELLADEHFGVHVATLTDRFGDLGVVAVAIVDRTDPQSRVLDSVIMSCRAMGFGLEALLLHDVLRAEPAQTHVGLFSRTDRNGPAASLFPDNGLTETGPGRYELPAGDDGPKRPPWFG